MGNFRVLKGTLKHIPQESTLNIIKDSGRSFKVFIRFSFHIILYQLNEFFITCMTDTGYDQKDFP